MEQSPHNSLYNFGLPDAYFSLSKSAVVEQYNKLKELGALISYSVKTNPSVTPILESQTDSEFHVHTLHDAQFVVNKSKIWFMMQGNDKHQFQTILSSGIQRFIVDNLVDLHHLVSWIGEFSSPVDVMLRVKMKEKTVFTERHFVFGIDPLEIPDLIKELRANKNIGRLGLHMHRKTQNISEWNLQTEFSSLFSEEFLSFLDVIDIGGGLPSAYKNSSDGNLPAIFKQITSLVDWLRTLGVSVIIEPGRFLSAAPVKLHVFVQSVYDNTIVVNASVYNCALDSILVVPTRLLVHGEGEQGMSYTIKGYTPDSLDIFRYGVKLVRPVQRGDEIIFLNAGAYNFSTNYYGLPTLKTVIVP